LLWAWISSPWLETLPLPPNLACGNSLPPSFAAARPSFEEKPLRGKAKAVMNYRTPSFPKEPFLPGGVDKYIMIEVQPSRTTYRGVKMRTLLWAFGGLIVGTLLAGSARAAEGAATAEQIKFFESRIRPALADHCYQCHSQKAKEVQGSLFLDSRAGLRRGGDSGPAIVPGSPEKSLLIKAIGYKDADRQMPPKESGGKLPDQVIKDFEAWVKMGAPDPRTAAAPAAASTAAKARTWWAFQPLHPVAVPQPKNTAWPRDDLDRFVLAKLDEQHLQPVADAGPRVLLRRLYFDLTGLPPSPKELGTFVTAWNNTSDHQALISATVDHLLESPQFGERWARHWLDVARYAESCGKDVNVVYTNAWRYLFYVVQAFNGDTPYNRFLREQIAGDLLPARSESERARNLVATGFLAVGPKSLNEMRARQFAVDVADEQIDTTTQAFLGLTVSCARCHDHKFDPISQRDYTAMAGVFLSTDTKFGTAGNQGRNQSTLVELPAGAHAPLAAEPLSPDRYRSMQTRLADMQKQTREAFMARRMGQKLPNGLNPGDLARIQTISGQLESELAAYRPDGSPKALAMGVSDKPLQAPMPRRFGFPLNPNGPGGMQFISGFEQLGDSPLFTRGNIDTPTGRIPRGIPAIVAPHARPIPARSSGRLELADGLASADNPLTSRVIVNRVWLWMFGRGLVESADNFGASGATPSHPELLDFLAQRFVREGWSIKRLVREIALSRTYQLASTFDDASFTADPENRWLWRHSARRLEAEEIRDAMLAVAGRLDLQPPLGTLIGRGNDGPIGGGPRISPLSEQQVTQADSNGRSLYLPLPRNVQPTILATFDMPDASAVQSARDATNVPSQALFLLNSDFVSRQALLISNRLLRQFPGQRASDRFEDRIMAAYRLSLSRPPRDVEIAAARKLVERHNLNPATAWSSLAQGLLACAEFRLLD
jgi:cytochrome c553